MLFINIDVSVFSSSSSRSQEVQFCSNKVQATELVFPAFILLVGANPRLIYLPYLVCILIVPRGTVRTFMD